MFRTFSALLLAAAATGAAAGPYDQPYSIITVSPIRSADHHLKNVFVNRVDGENSIDRNKHVVPPGDHEVVLDLPPVKGFHLPRQQSFTLRTEPCVRYNLAARVETSISQKWEPVVRSTEPIGECASKFKIAKQ